MPFGYHGCYLRIDVGKGSAERVPVPDGVLRQYIGGSGLGARLLLDEVLRLRSGQALPVPSGQGGTVGDPLAPEAPLVFAFSPLVGSPLTTSAKFAVVSRSPLTERFNDSLASSGFAVAGKGAVIVSQDGATVKYRMKCTTCGHEDASWKSIPIPHGTARSGFFCRKCRKRRDAEIHGYH